MKKFYFLILLLALFTFSGVTFGQIFTTDFNFSGSLTSNGWTLHSGAGTNPISTTTGLTYSGYLGSGIGNAALVNNLGGEDDNISFTNQNTNGQSIYWSFLVNITDASASKAGDYFTHLGTPGGASFTLFCARVFAKITSGVVNFGVSNTSTATYGTTAFAKNTTYLLIVKYTITVGGNDVVSLWVVPSGVPATEVLAGTPEVTNSTTAGQDQVNTVALRQGSATNSPQVVVDGIRIGTSWSTVTGEPSTNASNVTFGSVTSSSMNISWTNGNGVSRVVLVKSGSAVDSDPLDGTTYTANSAFGSGSEIGTGNFVVYDGSGSSVSVTGLTASTAYYVAVYEYNGSGSTINYLTTTPGTGNQTTLGLASPTIVTTGSLTSFGNTYVGTPSGSQSFSVSGTNLTDNIIVTPPTGFEIRKGADAFSSSAITLVPSGGTVASTGIDVRFNPASTGLYNANVTCASTGATTQNVSASGTALQNFYCASSGDLDNVLNWGTSTDGTGVNPADFITYGQIFNITNNPNATIGADWTVSGTNSKIVVGDGTNPVEFIIPAANTVTGTIDIALKGVLTLENPTTLSHTYGTVNGTINFAQSGTYVVPLISTTGNLKLTGGTKTLSAGTYTIQGNFIVDGVTDLNGAGLLPFSTVNLAKDFILVNGTTFSADVVARFTVNCNGSSAQTFQGNNSSFHLFRILMNNSNGLSLSTSGGTSNVTLGNANATSGGVTLTSGSINTNSNTITFYNSEGARIQSPGEVTGKYIIGSLTVNRTAVGTLANVFGNIGVSLAAGTDSLGDVTVSRVTGTSGIISAMGNEGIKRNWTISSTIPPASGRDVTFTWISDDDNGKDLANAIFYSSTDGGTTWIDNGTTFNGTSRTYTLTGATSFGKYTVSDAASFLPVELSSFTSSVNGSCILLNWVTATEVNNSGFDIERSSDKNSWTKVSFVQGHGISNSTKEYSFTDNSITKSGKYYYRLKQIDKNGAFHYSSLVEADLIKPVTYSLDQNFPNPFNPSTVISYTLPEASNVKLTVYNSIGQAVKILESGYKEAGFYKLSFNASELSSGIYFYRLDAGKFSQIRKMLLIK